MKLITIVISGAVSLPNNNIKKEYVKNYKCHAYPEGDQDIIDTILFTHPNDKHIAVLNTRNPLDVDVVANGNDLIFHITSGEDIPTRWLSMLLLTYYDSDISLVVDDEIRILDVGYEIDECGDPRFDFEMNSHFDESLLAFFTLIGQKRFEYYSINTLPAISVV